MGIYLDEKILKSLLEGKLSRHFGKDLSEASKEQIYASCAFIVRDMMMENWAKTQDEIEKKELKQVYYLSKQ